MTAHELRTLREEKQQTPRSMADALGINIATFYLWERGKLIPKHFELAIKFLATQELPKAQQNRRKADGGFQTKFAPGARFGRLVVVANVTQEAGRSRHRRVQVQCDCGEWKVMRATQVAGAMECSYHCPLKGTRIPTAEKPAPERPLSAPVVGNQFLPEAPNPDEPDLDAPEIEWLKYHDRKEREKAAELNAAFDGLNDEIAPYDDQTPIDAIGEWDEVEEGLEDDDDDDDDGL